MGGMLERQMPPSSLAEQGGGQELPQLPLDQAASGADACLCYISLGPREDAQAIARTLVEERLAAAVNLHSGVNAFYRWQGRVEEAAEVTLIAKTRAALVELHSYACPAVVAVPIHGGHPDYLAWIEENC